MKKVLFYGDSNTYGYDPAGFMGGRYPRQQRWTGILAERLAGEWEIAADGMPGRMIPGNAYSIEIALDAVKADGPMDLFAVMLGTNDLLNQRHPYSPAVAARMQKLLDSAQESLTAKILLIAPPQIRFTDPSCTDPFVRGDAAYANGCRKESIRLAQHYRALAAGRGIFWADASSWDLGFSFDGVHLSEEGHETFAGEMAKILQKIEKEL
ncbi:MAG: hypothetical protein IJ110_02390 [Lachnospiraceae bacterium]|jgi:lysophospholipase L1-like esterase|nr:hypothetical protein [Lachnospiraceae bacterium]